MQFQSLSGCKRSGKHERYEIVAFSLQLRSLDGLVLKKLNRLAFLVHTIDLQITRQLKHERPLSSAADSNLDVRRCLQASRRLHYGTNPEICDGNVNSGSRRRSFARGCPAHTGSPLAPSQNTSKAPSFPPSRCACNSRGNSRMGSVPLGVGRKWLKSSSKRSASEAARFRLIWFRCFTKSPPSSAGDRNGCNTAAVSSLNRR